jgi:hypothetical protein
LSIATELAVTPVTPPFPPNACRFTCSLPAAARAMSYKSCQFDLPRLRCIVCKPKHRHCQTSSAWSLLVMCCIIQRRGCGFPFPDRGHPHCGNFALHQPIWYRAPASRRADETARKLIKKGNPGNAWQTKWPGMESVQTKIRRK